MSGEARGFTALVLAGQRPGTDPLARHCGVELKCMAPVGGTPMLQRVVEVLARSPHIRKIFISLPDPTAVEELPLLTSLHAEGRLHALRSAPSPSASVSDFCARQWHSDSPLLVTTADHALLNDEILNRFCRQALSSEDDILAGLTPSAVLKAAYPDSRRTYLRFRDEAYSGANLFALLTPRAQKAVTFWQTVEQDRKKPWRIARRIGIRTLIAYLARRLTLKDAMQALSRIAGAQAGAVILPIAEAAIDVDKPEDLDLVKSILAERANEQGPASN
ncbi:nucleotidyltransferase family protein [Fodinicurvata fenggangensis]|uniref:nucleotidyltransferase family protein n=1 Tax=Fodinicurvata fenggangensis TaxID=1121830 RepID=UPI00047D297C|nr:nucleotidyltransferase family protein [Fodinicurvata fenggangensis]